MPSTSRSSSRSSGSGSVGNRSYTISRWSPPDTGSGKGYNAGQGYFGPGPDGSAYTNSNPNNPSETVSKVQSKQVIQQNTLVQQQKLVSPAGTKYFSANTEGEGYKKGDVVFVNNVGKIHRASEDVQQQKGREGIATGLTLKNNVAYSNLSGKGDASATIDGRGYYDPSKKAFIVTEGEKKGTSYSASYGFVPTNFRTDYNKETSAFYDYAGAKSNQQKAEVLLFLTGQKDKVKQEEMPIFYGENSYGTKNLAGLEQKYSNYWAVRNAIVPEILNQQSQYRFANNLLAEMKKGGEITFNFRSNDTTGGKYRASELEGYTSQRPIYTVNVGNKILAINGFTVGTASSDNKGVVNKAINTYDAGTKAVDTKIMGTSFYKNIVSGQKVNVDTEKDFLKKLNAYDLTVYPSGKKSEQFRTDVLSSTRNAVNNFYNYKFGIERYFSKPSNVAIDVGTGIVFAGAFKTASFGAGLIPSTFIRSIMKGTVIAGGVSLAGLYGLGVIKEANSKKTSAERYGYYGETTGQLLSFGGGAKTVESIPKALKYGKNVIVSATTDFKVKNVQTTKTGTGIDPYRVTLEKSSKINPYIPEEEVKIDFFARTGSEKSPMFDYMARIIAASTTPLSKIGITGLSNIDVTPKMGVNVDSSSTKTKNLVSRKNRPMTKQAKREASRLQKQEQYFGQLQKFDENAQKTFDVPSVGYFRNQGYTRNEAKAFKKFFAEGINNPNEFTKQVISERKKYPHDAELIIYNQKLPFLNTQLDVKTDKGYLPTSNKVMDIAGETQFIPKGSEKIGEYEYSKFQGKNKKTGATYDYSYPKGESKAVYLTENIPEVREYTDIRGTNKVYKRIDKGNFELFKEAKFDSKGKLFTYNKVTGEVKDYLPKGFSEKVVQQAEVNQYMGAKAYDPLKVKDEISRGKFAKNPKNNFMDTLGFDPSVTGLSFNDNGNSQVTQNAYKNLYTTFESRTVKSPSLQKLLSERQLFNELRSLPESKQKDYIFSVGQDNVQYGNVKSLVNGGRLRGGFRSNKMYLQTLARLQSAKKEREGKLFKTDYSARSFVPAVKVRTELSEKDYPTRKMSNVKRYNALRESIRKSLSEKSSSISKNKYVEDVLSVNKEKLVSSPININLLKELNKNVQKNVNKQTSVNIQKSVNVNISKSVSTNVNVQKAVTVFPVVNNLVELPTKPIPKIPNMNKTQNFTLPPIYFTPPTPPPPPPPIFPIMDFSGGGWKRRNERQYSKKPGVYSQDFTAKVLDLTLRINKKNNEKIMRLINKSYTGLEERFGFSIGK